MIGTAEERFWSKVEKGPYCWNWTASKHEFGYGWFNFQGKLQGAHRVAWQLENGPIPEGLCIRHSCDNPGCVRPSHLLLGTQADNRRDCVERGRGAVGEINGNSRLTEAQASAIRKSTKTQRATAREFGVHQATVWRIKHGKTWANAEASPV